MEEDKKRAAVVIEKRNELKLLEARIAAAKTELSSLERQRDSIGVAASAVEVAA